MNFTITKTTPHLPWANEFIHDNGKSVLRKVPSNALSGHK